MTERIPKSVIRGGVVLGPLVLAYLAYSRPGYFTSQTYLGGLLLLELLAAAVWMYRRCFFPLVMVTFLLAGVNLPVGSDLDGGALADSWRGSVGWFGHHAQGSPVSLWPVSCAGIVCRAGGSGVCGGFPLPQLCLS